MTDEVVVPEDQVSDDVENAEEQTQEDVEVNTEDQAEDTQPEEADEGEGDSEDDEDDGEEEVEEIEFDFGGTKLTTRKDAIPQEVAEGLQTYAKNIEADYTRKTQAIAETSKSLQAREAAIQKLEGLHGEALEMHSQGIALQNEIKAIESHQVQNPDMWQSDPDQARQLSDRRNLLESQLNQVISAVNQKDQELSHTQAAEITRRRTEGETQLERRIKTFKTDLPKLKEYVQKHYGVTKEEADNYGLNPSGAEMAYKAMKYDEMQSKVKKRVKKPATPVAVVKPLKPKGKPQGKKLAQITDPEEYRKRWMAQNPQS